MARDDNERLFNGSAAYQLYSDFESTAAPEIQHPDLPQERPRHKKVRRVKVKTAVSPVAVVGLLAVTCMLILVVFGYVQLYEASEEVSYLQSELSELQERQVVLQSLYEEGIDLDYVEERAAELGLRMPTKEQTVYINLAGSDQAEIYTSEQTNIFQRILQAIERSASGLVEYLS